VPNLADQSEPNQDPISPGKFFPLYTITVTDRVSYATTVSREAFRESLLQISQIPHCAARTNELRYGVIYE
jgi:hypothetical protein